MNRRIIIEVLKRYDVPQEEIRLLSNMYWSQIAQVRGNSRVSFSFKIEKVTKQDSVFSPVFLNKYSKD